MLKIKPLYFFVSLSIGLLITYIYTPIPDIIYQYPTPENTDLTYIDKSNMCYKYEASEVKCPKNKKEINHYPVQV